VAKGYRQLERVVRGFSNHRRIQMLETLDARPELDLLGLARACGVNVKTAAEHTRRLAAAGLIFKRSKGRNTLHTVSPRGHAALGYLRAVQ
jgi:hypothetical protein